MRANATKMFLSMLLTLVLASVSTFASIDSTDTGGSGSATMGPVATQIMGADDNSSIIIKQTDKTKKVTIPSRNRSYTAGTFKGLQNGNWINFYCIDINTGLQWNTEYVYDGQTSLELYYVLNNYYPVGGRQFDNAPLNLSETEEAAATQLAIWHFSDNIDISNSTPSNVLQAAQTIIADANANALNPARTIEINILDDQDFKIGEPIKFIVEVYTENNTPAANVDLELTSNGGVLSATNVSTNSHGITDTLEITQLGGATTATIEVSGDIQVPAGSRFVKKGAPNSSQKLILAGTALLPVSKSVTVNWYGEPELSIEKTAKVNGQATNTSTKVKHGDAVEYTITVTNSNTASAAATGIQVSDILPTVLVNVSTNPSQGTYDQNTGIWAVGDLAVGATATLVISTTVELGNNGSGGIYDLGPAKDFNLFVLQSINSNTSSDTEGKVAVGKDAIFESGYSIGYALPESGWTTEDALIVGRRLTFGSGRIYGKAVYGSFVDTVHHNTADGGFRKEKNVIDFGYARTYLKTLSKQLYALPENGTVTFDESGTLKFEGTDPVLNVFKVNKKYTEEDGSGNPTYRIYKHEIIVPEGAIAVINYAGKNINFQTGDWEVNGVRASGETSDDHRRVGSKVLLNFWQAKNLVNPGGLGMIGSILAPKATLDYRSGVIYGQVIVKEIVRAHQFNLVKFDGEIQLDTTITNVAQILTYNEKSGTIPNVVGETFAFAQLASRNITDVEVIDNNEVPNEFELKQNYPNPFNPSTKIEFAIAKDGQYRVEVYNIVGQKVVELVNGDLAPGTYTVQFDASKLASGIYFYKLAGDNVNFTKKMMLIK